MKHQIPVKIMFTESFQVTKCGVHQNYPYLKVPIVRRNPSSCILWHFPRLADISDSARTTTGRLTLQVREAIKKASFFRTLSKSGGWVQLESKKFWGSYFSPSLTFFWTLNGGRGDDQIPKVLRHFLPKYWVNIWILGLYKTYLTVVQNGPIKSYLTGVQNEGGGWRPLLENVQKKDAFLWLPLTNKQNMNLP